MAKQSGICGTITIDDSAGTARNISQDVTSVSAGTPRGVQELRGINKTAMERILLSERRNDLAERRVQFLVEYVA